MLIVSLKAFASTGSCSQYLAEVISVARHEVKNYALEEVLPVVGVFEGGLASLESVHRLGPRNEQLAIRVLPNVSNSIIRGKSQLLERP